MAFNTFNQYSANHKTWDHVGNIIPDVEHSEGIRPAIEWKPASWLPVQFFDKYYEIWYVTMPGKIVACDNDGRIVPAQYGLSGATITYTTNDVEAGVIDVRTGKPLLASATGTFNVSAVSAFLGESGVALSVSKPLGVAPYGYHQWAGGDGSNPANYRQHNHNLQHQVAVLCDYVVQVPLVPAEETNEALTFNAPDSNNVSASNAVSNLPLATNTVRTPMEFSGGDSATLFVRQVDELSKVTSAGDWHVNTTTGVISVYATSAPTSITLDYFHYASAPTSVSKFASAVGNLKCGDFVVCDSNSNFAVATTQDFKDIMGQVLDRDDGHPKDALDRVRTAYNPAINTDASGGRPGYSGQLDQMPGSATGGVPANIHYAGAADTIVRINLVSR